MFIHIKNVYLGCVHALAMVNSAATNTGVHVSFRIMFCSSYMPRSRIAGSYYLVLVFLGTSILVSIADVPIYTPTKSWGGFPSLHTLSSNYCLWIFSVTSVTQLCLRPHGLQHARPPCPSPTPGAYSNSCPSSR